MRNCPNPAVERQCVHRKVSW